MKRPALPLMIALTLAGAAAAATPPPVAPPQARSPEAEQAFGEGRFADASRLLATAIAACRAPPGRPDHCFGLLLLGASAATAAGEARAADLRARQALTLAEGLPDGGRAEQMLALLTLGGAAIGEGRIDEAERAYRKALGLSVAAAGAGDPLTATAENSLSLLLDAQGRLAEAETLHRRSIATIRATMGAGAKQLPTMIAGLGDNLAAQARFAEAERSYDEAIALGRAANGPTHPAVAMMLNSLAGVKQKRGRFAEAEALLREAAAIDLAALGPDHPLVGRDASNLGALYLDAGRLGEAEAQFRRALHASERQGADHPALASDLGNLAATLRQAGRSDEAVTMARRALDIDSAAFGAESIRAAGHYANIAANLEDQGRYREAEALRRRALDITRALVGAAHPDTAAALASLAANLGRQGRTAEAEPLLRRARAVQRARSGRTSAAVALVDSQLGLLLAQDGRAAAAVPLFGRALRIRRRVLGEWHPDTAGAYHNRAAILDQLGRAAAAEAPARRALAIRRAVLAPSHPDIAISAALLAGILARDPAGRAEAIGLLREGMAIARGRRLRAFAGRSGGDAVELAQQRAGNAGRTAADPVARVFATFLTVAARRSADAPGEAAALGEAMFVAAQDLDVSAAGLAMAQTAARTAAGRGPLATLVRMQQDLAARARLLDGRLIEAIGAARTERAAALRDDLARAGADLAAADAQLRDRFPDYARLISPDARGVADVQARLRPGEGLLLVRPAADDLFVFAVTPGRMAWHRVAGGAATTAAGVATIRCQVDPLTCAAAPPPAPGGDRAFDAGAAFALYDAIVRPVEPALADTKRLFVTVSGPLADLPLDLLVTTAPGAAGDLGSLDWLGERYAMITLPAVSALAAAPGPAAPRPAARGDVPFVGYGAPVVDGGDRLARLLAVPDDDEPSADRARLAALAPLPGTAVELRAMAGVLGGSPRDIVLGAAATETAVRTDPRVPRARVLAFATHGLLPRELNGRNEPALVMSLAGSPSATDDGLLSASEAAQFALGAEWVVLSACNTASAEGGADSLSALSRGFLYAGAQGLLASHWRVADDATAALTVETLAAARRQPASGRAAARQAAMHAVRTGRRADGSAVAGWTPDWRHPAAWAPFTLIAADDR